MAEILAAGLCIGPVDPLCSAVGGVAGGVAGAASRSVLDALGSSFVDAAQMISVAALRALDATTGVDLSAGWFRANVGVIAAVTLPAVVGLFVAQVIASVLRREPGGLARAVLGVGKAMLGAGLALAVTQSALVATDEICTFIAASSGTTVVGSAQRFLQLVWLSGPQSGPVLQMLLGLAIIIGCVLLWVVLLFRKAALILVAVFAPVAFAGSVWDVTRAWTRRWIEAIAALVLCKITIVVVFVVGGSAFSGVGPGTQGGGTTDTVPGQGVGSVAQGAMALSDLLVGLLLLTMASFAPWLTWRFLHWAGLEAAGVLHSAVATGPIPSTARAVGQQARFTGQWAVTSMLLGKVGGGAKGPGVVAGGQLGGQGGGQTGGGLPGGGLPGSGVPGGPPPAPGRSGASPAPGSGQSGRGWSAPSQSSGAGRTP